MRTLVSPHFTLEELTNTEVRDVDNSCPPGLRPNLEHLAETILEPLRMRFGPYIISSAYRCLAVNLAIGGSKTSAHMEANAADGKPMDSRIPFTEVIAYLKSDAELPVDQVIYEFGRWIHIGTRGPVTAKPLRRQFLMIHGAGKYEQWNPNDPRVKR